MDVFISWSGPTSKRLAAVLREWLPNVLHAVEPYYSEEDIPSGSTWDSEIEAALARAQIGLICITPDNTQAPSILFEAGALVNRVGGSKLTPVLFDVRPADLKWPLSRFHARTLERDEMRKLMRDLNVALGEKGLDTARCDDAFEMWWGRLDAAVNEVRDWTEAQDKTETQQAPRPWEDMIPEILELLRYQQERLIRPFDRTGARAAGDLFRLYIHIIRRALVTNTAEKFGELFEQVSSPAYRILTNPHLPEEDTGGRRLLKELEKALAELEHSP